MTLELTAPSKLAVRVGCETSAEIAKYRLKGILYWDRQKCPAWRWVKTLDVKALIGLRGIKAANAKFHEAERLASLGIPASKDRYRWERRK